jgi:hypothetical protein
VVQLLAVNSNVTVSTALNAAVRGPDSATQRFTGMGLTPTGVRFRMPSTRVTQNHSLALSLTSSSRTGKKR